MIVSLIVLAVRTNFAQDIILPACVGGAVLVVILNQVLGHFGYRLF